jgi:hypothetical protein
MTTSEARAWNPFSTSWWSAFFFSDYTANSLGLFRIWFAATMVLYALWDFGYLLELDPLGPIFYFADPIWYFRLVGISIHVPWLTPLLLATLIAATVALGFGFFTRIALVVMFLAIAYLQGTRDSFDGAVHHRMVVPANILIILFFSRCGDVLSKDSSRWRRQGRLIAPVESWAASWPLRAIQVYIAFYYFFAAVAKLRMSGWVWIGDGGKVQTMLIDRSMRYGLTDAGEAVRGKLGYLLAQSPGWLVAFVTAVIVFELLSPLILVLIRSLVARLVFVAGATTFHIGNFVLLSVNFIFYPLLLAVFFDLEKVYLKLQRRFGWKSLP